MLVIFDCADGFMDTYTYIKTLKIEYFKYKEFY